MDCNQAGIELIKSFEECRLTSYRDSRGILTIGWGHTGPEVVEGLVWTQEQADAQFDNDLSVRAALPVNTAVKVTLTENEFSALCSFVYNVGAGNFRASHLLAVINDDEYADVRDEFMKWDHNHDGTISAGLQRRRIAEVALWNLA